MEATLIVVMFHIVSVNYACQGWKPKPGEEFNSQCQESRIEYVLKDVKVTPLQTMALCKVTAPTIGQAIVKRDKKILVDVYCTEEKL